MLIQEALEKVSKCVEVARSALDSTTPYSGVSVVVSKPPQARNTSKTLQHHTDSAK